MTRDLVHKGVAFQVGPRNGPGISWRIPVFDHLGRQTGYTESMGAFYDGCEDHPEGAYAWAELSARRYIDTINIIQ